MRSTGSAVNSKPGDFGKRRGKTVFLVSIIILIGGLLSGWLAFRALQIEAEMSAARPLLSQFEDELTKGDLPAASSTLAKLRGHGAASQSAATDPIWTAARALPLIGTNFSAVTELALSSVELADGAATPVLKTLEDISIEKLMSGNGGIDLAAISGASPALSSAADTVSLTHGRLSDIETSALVPQIAAPLDQAIEALAPVKDKLTDAANASKILPSLLGAEGARNYLVLVQNNAEIRATGGLAGALAVLRAHDGRIELVTQSSGSALGMFSPAISVDPNQTTIYSNRLGKFIGDVNLTPDFPTVAASAKAMWESRHSERIEGVIAIDPVVLAHLLDASGPLEVAKDPATTSGLPATLTAGNVVKTLLSDVYTHLEGDSSQDAYFADVSRKIFESVSSGSIPGPKLLDALSKSVSEGRVLVWSAHKPEQEILTQNPLGGSISGPAASGAAFGVYFNDGTGAKMDFYVRRSVQLAKFCENDGYSLYKVRVKQTNTAPPNAATSLPDTVTGAGLHGVPAGFVQTNVVIYGPAFSQVDITRKDGTQVPFASHLHENRPVGTMATRLAPGQSTELEMTFITVVQDSPPNIRVTPTVQPVHDVWRVPEYVGCG